MMDIKRLFQIPLIFLLIPLFFLVMLIKIYILQYIIMNRIAVWGGSFWMVLFLFCLPALEVLSVWKIIVYHYSWKVREKLISSSYSRGDILVLYQAIKSWDTAYLGGALLDAAITFPALCSVWWDCEMVWTACRYFFLKDYKRTNVIFIVP